MIIDPVNELFYSKDPDCWEPRWYPNRLQLPVSGPPSFVAACRSLLKDLRRFVPQRFFEALSVLPWAVYDPERLHRESGMNCLGRSDGIFAVDGSDEAFFSFVLAHEIGHNLYDLRNGDSTEEEADRYAVRVLNELRAAKAKEGTSTGQSDRQPVSPPQSHSTAGAPGASCPQANEWASTIALARDFLNRNLLELGHTPPRSGG